jgi:two-component system chemotaxis sensor kinase CheA
MADNDEMVSEFLVQSSEKLDGLNRELVALEQNPSDQEILATCFRTIHNIRGASGLLGFSKLEAVTDAGERLLTRLRDGEIPLNAEIIRALLALGDAARQMLANIKNSGHEGDTDYSALADTLTLLREGLACRGQLQPQRGRPASVGGPLEG